MGIGRKEALECFRSNDLVGIGMEADAVRRVLHPEGVVSYAIGRTIDYTALLDAEEERAFEVIGTQVRETLEAGGTSVTLQGSPDRRGKVEWFERAFLTLRQSFPTIWLQCLSAGEVRAIAENSGISMRGALIRLRDAGLDSIAGSGMEQAGWADVHRTAHGLGITTTAEMVFGAGETAEERVERLESVRQVQEETGGFAAFVPVSFSPLEAVAGGRELDEATAVEALKTVAISRMMLENIANLQANGATRSLKVLQMALRFGSNDAGSVTVGLDGPGSTSEEEMRRVIRDAGFKPVERDMPYRTMFIS